MSRPIAPIAALGIALCALSCAAAEQTTQTTVIRFLDSLAPKDGGAPYIVTPGSDLVLPFIVDKGGKLELYFSPFRGEHGDTVLLQSSIDGLSSKDQRLAFSAIDGSVHQLRLTAPALSHPGKYSGTLTATLDGKRQQTDRLELTRSPAPRQAKLVVDWKSPTVYERTLAVSNITDLLFGVQPASFNLQLRNMSADWPAEGIFFRVLDVTAPAGSNFDPGRHLKLTWNGAQADDLWQSPSAKGSARAIAPNQLVAVGGQPSGLAPGEYSVKIGLGGSNIAIDNENPVTVKLYAKHGVLLPLTILLLAIVISWIATKGLEAQRRRAAQLAKVNEVRKRSMRQERDSIPAVAARAFLRQAEDRNERWFDALFGQDTTTAHVTKAELLGKVLERAGALRERIKDSGWRTLTMHRANKRLTAILASINAEAIDAAAAATIESQLAELEKWFDPKQHDTLYMGALKNDLETLLQHAQKEIFDEAHQGRIEELRSAIEAVTKRDASENAAAAAGAAAAPKDATASRDAVAKMERAYGILKILWERKSERDKDALERLFGVLNEQKQISIEDFFNEADEAAWSRLVTADFAFVKGPKSELEPPRAFELVEFAIAPTEPKLGNNFLFKHKASYVWTLEMKEADHRTTVTEQRTNEPRVVQYAPQPGTYYMKVALEHNGQAATKPPEPFMFTVGKSSEYGVLSILRFTEIAALAIATLFAVVSGLATYYFGKAAFGSITDYVSLFMWGAGVDQAKNFLQQLGKVSGTGVSGERS